MFLSHCAVKMRLVHCSLIEFGCNCLNVTCNVHTLHLGTETIRQCYSRLNLWILSKRSIFQIPKTSTYNVLTFVNCQSIEMHWFNFYLSGQDQFACVRCFIFQTTSSVLRPILFLNYNKDLKHLNRSIVEQDL